MKESKFIKLNFKFEISNFCANVKVKITSLRTAVRQLANTLTVQEFSKWIVVNYICTGCPRVAKKLHNLFVIKDINFFFILDGSYPSTACSENIAVYILVAPKFADQRSSTLLSSH
jgi:hypothetical protein